MLSLLLSILLKLIRLKTSVIKLDLIAKSNGESVAKDGDIFTSSIHGLRFESRRTSNPKTSNQLFLKLEIFLMAV